ncbi:MAG: tRNA pseudouridine(55) synthase TruB [Chloroflexi bacterium]|nr:tRNA pseudouridine(55) synthase TruB [Chloroflexota bacterium]
MAKGDIGVLNIDKPSGLSSHDVVARVRRLTGVRRVGHAGTLDPLATGVLLVCLGSATRIVEYLQASAKTYQTTIRLGQTTDTYDAEGRILKTAPVPSLTPDELERALDHFRGEIAQIPPMYSALKLKGRSLHELARAGVTVERKPRRVTIYELDLDAWDPPFLTITAVCTPGTYIRSLAHDIGERLGCGGHVTALRRLASGTWRVEDAVTLEELEAAGPRWRQFVHGLSAALGMLPPLVLPEDLVYRFSVGQRFTLPNCPYAGEVRVFGPRERLVGVGRVDRETCLLAPHKVLKPVARQA